MSHALSVVLFAPVAGAAAIAVAGSHVRRIRGAAIVSTVAACLVALSAWIRFEPRGAEWQFARQIDLVPALGLRYAVGVDGFSLSLVLVATLVAAACAVWSVGRATDERVSRAWVDLLLMETGALGVLVSLDVVQLAVFWAVAMVAALRAIGIEGSGGTARASSWLRWLTVLAGVTLAGAIAVLHVRYRALAGFSTFDLRALQTLTLSPALQVWLFAAFLLPFALPLCVLVFRMRSLEAGARAPFAEGLLGLVFVSSILLQAGTYGLVRVGMTIVPGGVRLVSPYVIGACALAGVAAAVAAIRQKDLGSIVLFGGVSLFTAALLTASMLTPRAITIGVVLQIVQSATTATLLLAATAAHRAGGPAARYAGVRNLLALAPLAIAIAGTGFRPAPLLARLETSVARVVLRVSPQYAPQVADCLSQPAKPPDPAETGLPAGMVIAAPCADGQGGSHDAKK